MGRSGWERTDGLREFTAGFRVPQWMSQSPARLVRDGEDLLTPMAQQSAEAIVAAITRSHS
jgi:hypothetical protein